MVLNLYQFLSQDERKRSSQELVLFSCLVFIQELPLKTWQDLTSLSFPILEPRFNIKFCTRSWHLIMLVNDARNATKILSRSYNKVFIFLKQKTKIIFVARYLPLLMRYFKVRIGRGNLARSYNYFVCKDRKKREASKIITV